MRVPLVLLLTALCLTSAAADTRSNDCGRILHREHNGIIFSHRRFERRVYPSNYTCLWRIQAPPGYRIRLLLSVFSVEYEKRCSFDHLDIYDDTNTRDPKKRLARKCGSDLSHFYISSGVYMTLEFHSDRGVRKMGFQLRYDFIPKDSVAAGARLIERRNCTGMFKCRKNGLCIPRKFLCDKHNDCGDHSDERRCPGMPPNSKCTNDEYKCRRRRKCIPNYYKCDGIRDCRYKDDEQDCTPPIPTPATTTPTTKPPTTPAPTTPATTTAPIRKNCGHPQILPDEDEGRVVGGKVAIPGSWPWTVSLRYKGGHVCGGSIIAPRWVLTATHCVEGYMYPPRYTVVAGLHYESTTGPGTQTIGVRRIVRHPNWVSQTTDYDFTLLYLTNDLNYTDRIGPICLPSKVLGRGVGCFAAGWGETYGTGGAGYLKQAFVKTFNHAECNGFYGGITGRMLCAGHREGGQDTCQGDSGGPLMCKINGTWELHGATSFGGVCAAPNSPGVYARMSAALSWIKRVTGL